MGEPSDFEDFCGVIASPNLLAIANHWNKARGDKLMPSWSDLSSTALSAHFKLLWGFRYDARSDEFMGLLAGAHVKEWLGANFWGAKLKDIHLPHVEMEARRFLSTVIAMPAAGRCSGTLFTAGGKAVPGERIALPLSTDGLHGDGVLGASDYEYTIASGPVELVHENLEWFALRSE